MANSHSEDIADLSESLYLYLNDPCDPYYTHGACVRLAEAISNMIESKLYRTLKKHENGQH